MNRMQRWTPRVKTPPRFVSRIDRAMDDLFPSCSPDCALFVPHHYEPNYAYPLLVWLHGPGDDQRQLGRVMPHLSLRNYVAVGPCGCSAPLPGELGFRWSQTPRAIEQAEQRVFDSIDFACGRYHIAAEHVFLGGFQCGGTMALRVGLQHPERFAGVLSIGGSFPEGLSPLARLRQIRQLPIFIAQGRDSLEYPLQQSCDELRLFHVAALHVTLRQYPCADDLTTAMLADANAWLMEQVTGVRQESDSEVDSCCLDGLN
jgi:phospholipase/carboxylesterase